MSPESLRQALRRQPFVPVKIYLTDGKTYEIRHPEMALVSQREVLVGAETKPGSGVAAEFDMVSLLHVVRVEWLTQPPTAVGNN